MGTWWLVAIRSVSGQVDLAGAAVGHVLDRRPVRPPDLVREFLLGHLLQGAAAAVLEPDPSDGFRKVDLQRRGAPLAADLEREAVFAVDLSAGIEPQLPAAVGCRVDKLAEQDAVELRI